MRVMHKRRERYSVRWRGGIAYVWDNEASRPLFSMPSGDEARHSARTLNRLI